MPPQNLAGWSNNNNNNNNNNDDDDDGEYTETIEYIVEIEYIPDPSSPSLIPVTRSRPVPMATPPSIPGIPVKSYDQYTKANPTFTARPIKYPSVYYHLSSYPSVTLPPWTTITRQTASWESLSTSTTPTSSVATTKSAFPPLETKADSETYWHHGEHESGGGHSKIGLYAAAAVIPLALLAIIGAIVFFCMRRRRRQREKAIVDEPKPEMKMHWQAQPESTVQPYIMPAPAPAPAVLPHYTATHHETFTPPTSVSAQPVILGPIPSGVNGAYLTGIDTSDVVSVTSSGNRRSGVQDPFSDNNSLSEPPPPYRPRSIAPPSFTTNSSRQSSVRSTAAAPETSRTHLIERSPFDDPPDDDTISELSCPTSRRDGDAMSAVSDLSYQNEPVNTRPSL